MTSFNFKIKTSLDICLLDNKKKNLFNIKRFSFQPKFEKVNVQNERRMNANSTIKENKYYGKCGGSEA